jgi:hypothetical protein
MQLKLPDGPLKPGGGGGECVLYCVYASLLEITCQKIVMTEQSKKTRFIKGKNYVTKKTFCSLEAAESIVAIKK